MQTSDLNRKLKEMFSVRHGNVWVESDICESWKRSHSNCKGCKHHDQCRNFVHWKLSILDGHPPDKFLDHPETYNPEDHGDY